MFSSQFVFYDNINRFITRIMCDFLFLVESIVICHIIVLYATYKSANFSKKSHFRQLCTQIIAAHIPRITRQSWEPCCYQLFHAHYCIMLLMYCVDNKLYQNLPKLHEEQIKLLTNSKFSGPLNVSGFCNAEKSQ